MMSIASKRSFCKLFHTVFRNLLAPSLFAFRIISLNLKKYEERFLPESYKKKEVKIFLVERGDSELNQTFQGIIGQ